MTVSGFAYIGTVVQFYGVKRIWKTELQQTKLPLYNATVQDLER